MALHIISNERALAQWKALYDQPLKFAQRFHKRFLDEQPHLARLIADCIAAPTGTVPPNARPANSIEEQVGEVTDFAARIGEVMRREAGRPLRQLSQKEVEGHFQPILNELGKLPKPRELGGLADVLPLVTKCRQQDLLRGVCIAYFAGVPRTALDIFLVTALLRLAVDALDVAASAATLEAPAELFWSLERVEEALSVRGDPMRRAALDAAEEIRKELTPRLLAELEGWVADPQATLEEDDSLGMHALFLLAHWREKSAWPVFRRLFSLPGATPHDLCSEITTEAGPVLLASVVGERDTELRGMLEDETVEELCRATALEALACLVAWGEKPRAELIRYLRGLFSGRLKAAPANYIWASAVNVACDLEAWELGTDIDALFARGLVDESVVDRNFVADAQTGIFGSLWAEFIMRHTPIVDVADATAFLDEPFEGDGNVSNPAPESVPVFSSIASEGSTQNPFSETRRSPVIAPRKIGRNESCPCGSGKKYKKCCGR
jgi:hypothetical protein